MNFGVLLYIDLFDDDERQKVTDFSLTPKLLAMKTLVLTMPYFLFTFCAVLWNLTGGVHQRSCNFLQKGGSESIFAILCSANMDVKSHKVFSTDTVTSNSNNI